MKNLKNVAVAGLLLASALAMVAPNAAADPSDACPTNDLRVDGQPTPATVPYSDTVTSNGLSDQHAFYVKLAQGFTLDAIKASGAGASIVAYKAMLYTDGANQGLVKCDQSNTVSFTLGGASQTLSAGEWVIVGTFASDPSGATATAYSIAPHV